MQGTMRHATGCVAGAVKGARHVDNPFRVSDHHCDALGKGIMTLLKGRLRGRNQAPARSATVLVNFEWRRLCKHRAHLQWFLAELIEAASTQNQPAPFAGRTLTR